MHRAAEGCQLGMWHDGRPSLRCLAKYVDGSQQIGLRVRGRLRAWVGRPQRREPRRRARSAPILRGEAMGDAVEEQTVTHGVVDWVDRRALDVATGEWDAGGLAASSRGAREGGRLCHVGAECRAQPAVDQSSAGL